MPNIFHAQNFFARFHSLGRRKIVQQFVKFAIVGGFGFVVDSGFLYVGLDALHLGKVAAGFFSFPFAVIFTWFGNRVFTFAGATHSSHATQLSKFVAVCAVGLVFNRGTYSLLVQTIPLVNSYPVVGLLGGTCMGMFFNFFMSRKHVFGT